MQKIVLIGAGGSARDILDIIDACNQDRQTLEPLGYIVQAQYGKAGEVINDLPILGDFDWLEQHAHQVSVLCTLGAPHQRRRLVMLTKKMGCRFFSLIHPSVMLTRRVTIGEGVVIAAGCILTNNIRLGDHVQINLACTMTHDDILSDYVTLSPGVRVSGNVTLGEGCFVGTGANFVEKINVGAWSIIGAGCTVIRDMPDNSTIVGVPGKVIKTHEEGWYLK